MTHSDIYTKFMIEYDKADVTSSYPSLTEYETAVLLDKAYLALIAQKFTGNNTRRIAFEGDIKVIEDLRPLVTEYKGAVGRIRLGPITNELVGDLPEDMLYYVDAYVGMDNDIQNVQLVAHTAAQKSKATAINKPWLKEPIAYLDDKIHVFFDYTKFLDMIAPFGIPIYITYIRKPKRFTRDVTGADIETFEFDNTTEFECSTTMANELINLAVIFATENTESPRLNSMLQTKQLEA